MKRTVLLGIVGLSFMVALAQSTKFEGRVVSQDEIPTVFKSTQAEHFGDQKVIRWKRQESKGRKDQAFIRFVAVMKKGKGLFSNARFAEKGELLYYAEYYDRKTIPDFLRKNLEQNFPNQKATGGTRVSIYRTKKEYYRIRLKAGNTVTYVFYDKNGNPIDRNQLPSDGHF